MQSEFKAKNRSQKTMVKVHLIIEAILSIPKTIYINLRCFPIKTAIKMPILCSYKIKIIELHRRTIVLPAKVTPFMIKIGFGGSEGIFSKKGIICLEEGAIHFMGKASFSEGVSLRNNGLITIGKNFWANKNCVIWCTKKIIIGENVVFGWNIILRDSDGHLVIENKKKHNVDGNIIIGSHCWICSETHMLKDSGLGNDCILGYGSILTKKYNDNNTLYAGIPAKPIKNGIEWERG